MTQLKPNQPTVRETATTYRHRLLVVSLYPGYISLRPKGTRQAFAIDYGAIYYAAMKLAARQALAERAAQKKLKRPKR